jgi:hypothetical protein
VSRTGRHSNGIPFSDVILINEDLKTKDEEGEEAFNMYRESAV